MKGQPKSILAWVSATAFLLLLMVVIGGAMSVAYERGVTPARFGAVGAVVFLTVLIGATLLRAGLIRIGLIPKHVIEEESDASSGRTVSFGLWREIETRRRVEAELSAGRLWRAKQILQGQVGTYPFESGLYQLLGEVLLEMGDDIEAGKYRFLAGNGPEDDSAVALFLQQFNDPQHLFASFPAHAKLGSIDEYPVPVRALLRDQGVQPWPSSRAPRPPRRPVWSWIGRLWAAVFFVLIYGIVITGFVGLIGIFFSAF